MRRGALTGSVLRLITTRSPDGRRRGPERAAGPGAAAPDGSRVIARFGSRLLLGPLADRAFDQAKGPATAAAVVLVAGGLVFWRVRRKRAAAPAAWMEAACPACVGLSLLAGRVPSLAGLDYEPRAGSAEAAAPS